VTTSPATEPQPPAAAPSRRRARIWIVAGFAVFVFVGISALLARGLSGTGAERARVLSVLQAQARGDAGRVLALLPACRAEPACVAVTRARTRRLARPGRVEILAYEPSTRLALSTRTGTARVAWRIGSELPTVQCVRARREGPLSGGRVELLAISAPIGRERACP
jgi:hypothetical protein